MKEFNRIYIKTKNKRYMEGFYIGSKDMKIGYIFANIDEGICFKPRYGNTFNKEDLLHIIDIMEKYED